MITLVAEPTQVAQARRSLVEFAMRSGLPETRSGTLAVIVTELATNLLKHAGCGEILASNFEDQDGGGIEILSLDRGPGMKDVTACLQDGFSTAGSLGQGLGTIARKADHFRIYSRPGLGTVASARLVVRPAVPGTTVQCGAALMPYPGETLSGDAWAWAATPAGPTLFITDGSGHGAEAHRAAETAIAAFRRHSAEPLEDLAMRLHHALLPTAGAAIALARFDGVAGLLRYLGVGTMAGFLLTGGQREPLISHDGVAGRAIPCLHGSTHPYAGDALVVVTSDGLTARWDVSTHPGITAAHPSLLAGVLLRDCRRGQHDSAVAVMRMAV